MSRPQVYIVASPIGDRFADFSLAALQVIKEVEHLFVEADDAFLRRLRTRGIVTEAHTVRWLSEPERCVAEARSLVDRGESFALLASSGIPCFVDPGHEVIDMLLAERSEAVDFVHIGMSSALDAMLTMGGQRGWRLMFLGHVPETHSITAELFAHKLPVIYYVRGAALPGLFEQLRELKLALSRVLILKDVRKKSRARLFVCRDLTVPPDLSCDADVDCVVLITQRD